MSCLCLVSSMGLSFLFGTRAGGFSRMRTVGFSFVRNHVVRTAVVDEERIRLRKLGTAIVAGVTDSWSVRGFRVVREGGGVGDEGECESDG